MTPKEHLDNGDRVTIAITGQVGEYQAEVVDDVGTDRHPGPWLKVVGGDWPVLKTDDFIILSNSSLAEAWQTEAENHRETLAQIAEALGWDSTDVRAAPDTLNLPAREDLLAKLQEKLS